MDGEASARGERQADFSVFCDQLKCRDALIGGERERERAECGSESVRSHEARIAFSILSAL